MRARGEGAARPRVSNHEATYASSVTRNGQDARGLPGHPVKTGVKPIKLGRGQQPISLSRAAPRYRMRIHGRCRLIDEFITAPTERRLLR